jgi:hypothetical protein
VLSSSFVFLELTVLGLISWKRSFDALADEYVLAKLKKQALDRLLESGRISRSTYDVFNAEVDEHIGEIERQQSALLQKMSCKIGELEGQIRTLEMLLANFEIQHVAGEVSDEVYEREIGLLSVGLDTARQELNVVKEAAKTLSSTVQSFAVEATTQEKSRNFENADVSDAKCDVAEGLTAVQTAEKPEVMQEKSGLQSEQTKTEAAT